jgi:hypothetical protein
VNFVTVALTEASNFLHLKIKSRPIKNHPKVAWQYSLIGLQKAGGISDHPDSLDSSPTKVFLGCNHN